MQHSFKIIKIRCRVLQSLDIYSVIMWLRFVVCVTRWSVYCYELSLHTFTILKLFVKTAYWLCGGLSVGSLSHTLARTCYISHRLPTTPPLILQWNFRELTILFKSVSIECMTGYELWLPFVSDLQHYFINLYIWLSKNAILILELLMKSTRFDYFRKCQLFSHKKK
jgi:hypothetical protein